MATQNLNPLQQVGVLVALMGAIIVFGVAAQKLPFVQAFFRFLESI